MSYSTALPIKPSVKIFLDTGEEIEVYDQFEVQQENDFSHIACLPSIHPASCWLPLRQTITIYLTVGKDSRYLLDKLTRQFADDLLYPFSLYTIEKDVYNDNICTGYMDCVITESRQENSYYSYPKTKYVLKCNKIENNDSVYIFIGDKQYSKVEINENNRN